MLGRLIHVLVKSVQDGPWSVGAVVVVKAVVVNLRSILAFFERSGSKQEEFVNEALKIGVVRDAAGTFLEEELNYLVFKRVPILILALGQRAQQPTHDPAAASFPPDCSHREHPSALQ